MRFSSFCRVLAAALLLTTPAFVLARTTTLSVIKGFTANLESLIAAETPENFIATADLIKTKLTARMQQARSDKEKQILAGLIQVVEAKIMVVSAQTGGINTIATMPTSMQ